MARFLTDVFEEALEFGVFKGIGQFLVALGLFVWLVRKNRAQAKRLAELASRVKTLEDAAREKQEPLPLPDEPPVHAPAPEAGTPEARDPLPEPAELIEQREQPAHPPWYLRVPGGNLWAIGGVALLIAAFAMLITFLARRGFFTVETGIALAALTGTAMTGAGWRFRHRNPRYFRVLQGGGAGILYLAVFAAHTLTPYLPPAPGLALAALFVLLTITLALLQDSQILALVGFAGGFAAPALLKHTGGGLFQFAYFSFYLALDAGVLAISRRRTWRPLTLTAFACTFGSALFWVMTGYARRYGTPVFWIAEPFLLCFMGIFTLLGIRYTKGRGLTPVDALLLLGTPLVSSVIQWRLVSPFPHGLPGASAFFALLYLGLSLALRKRGEHGAPHPAQAAYTALAAVFALAAVPLAFSPEITGAVWAASAVAALVMGLREKRRCLRVGAAVIHVSGAAAFAVSFVTNAEAAASLGNPRFSGPLVIGLSALVMLSMRYRDSGFPLKPLTSLKNAAPFLAALWAFLWWFGAWSYAVGQSAGPAGYAAGMLLVCSLTSLGSYAAARGLRCPALVIGVIPAFLRAALLLFAPAPEHFRGPYIAAWLVFFLSQGAVLFAGRDALRTDTDIPPSVQKAHAAALCTLCLTAVAVLTWVLFFHAFSLSYPTPLRTPWPPSPHEAAAPVFMRALSAGLPAQALLAALSLSVKARVTPYHRKLLFSVLPAFLCAVLGIWFLTTLFYAGLPAPLPRYVPLLHPLEIQQTLCAAVLVRW
ncbi:MAG: DUF2339 domain-containing protein, partial [Spirochaetaceae bacterium]|nr:DUF2339 domain-containing protein [Spirochaetaceae bacterium]